MGKRWESPAPLSGEELGYKKDICQVIKCPELVAELIVRKGLYTAKDINLFFHPRLEDILDPFLFRDMEKAATRIIKAIENREKITVYGDYDVDGTTACAILVHGFSELGGIVDYHIPNRIQDGYGISSGDLSSLADNHTALVISVDRGINEIAEAAQLAAMHIDFIITDHHIPKEILPNALAIINPKVDDYPDKNLAGVGVAYKLLLGVYKKLGKYTEDNIVRFLDLVAAGTIADIVPLVGENRIFAAYGLRIVGQKTNPGLCQLIAQAGLSRKEINTSDIIFSLAPRINAAGRMGSAMRATELLLCSDAPRVQELCDEIEHENSKRQNLDQKTFLEACDIIDNKYTDLANTLCIVISSDDWHPGVIGIVASKLVEKYYRPIFMITVTEGLGSGSGRTIAGFDLFAALTDLDDIVQSYGGHMYATGLTIKEELIDRFELRLEKYASTHLNKELLLPPLELDSDLELYDINFHLLDWLGQFSPFGAGNNRAVFYTKKVIVDRYPYTVGRNHLKLHVLKDGRTLDLIGFNMGNLFEKIKKDDIIDIAYSLELNIWQGKKTIQGKLKDIVIHV